MRFLHTSDWHLGRSFHGVGMLAAQRRFVDQLLETVQQHAVDVVLVAGDVYDRALPGVDVVKVLDSALERLTALGVQVIVTSGNHDSATRLGFAAKVLERGGVHLRTRIEHLATPVLLPLAAASGPAAGPAGGPTGAHDHVQQVAVYGLPYLEPRMVAEHLGVDTPSHFAVTEAALQLVRADLASRTDVAQAVVLAHTFASGGITSDSERDLSIGGVGAVPLDLFDDFAYVALGHLHGRQSLSNSVRYSGSPLAYSFSEARHHKGGWLVDLGADGLTSVEAVSWPAEKELALLRGNLEDLLADPAHAAAESAYCQITLTDNERPLQAMDRLRARFPDTLVLAFEPANPNNRPQQSYSERVAQAADELELCCGFLDHVRGRTASSIEQDVLRASIERARELDVA